jgi:alpha-L-rhamnosidase
LLSLFARLSGKDEDAVHYANLADKIKSAINDKYLDQEKMIYANGSQTALSAALFQQVVPDHLKNKIVQKLSDVIAESNDHLDVGLLGSKYLLNALSENGYADLAFKVASQRTQPSWGWWMLQGQTTFQESWGIGISRNHIMYGEIIAWMFKSLAGILPDPDEPGFKHIILRPDFVEGLSHAEADHECVYGMIRAGWRRTKNKIAYNITIPANTTATVYLSKKGKRKIYESNKLIMADDPYIKYLKTNADISVYEIKAGTYQFEIK